MPYKKKTDEILVDPVAVAGVAEIAPAQFLQPGPVVVRSHLARPTLPALSAKDEAELNRKVMASAAASLAKLFAPPEPEIPEEVQAEIERLASIELPPPPAEMTPTLVTPDDCASCGHPNPAGQKFCGECGARIESAVKWACGHPNGDTNKFCGECGQPAFSAPVAGAGLAVEMAARADAPAQQLRPKPESMLTPAERKERERLHAAAVRLGNQMPEAAPEPPRTRDTVLIHFLEDGITFAGQVWYRGQEIELDKSSDRYLMQGQYWMHLSDFDQVQRYGKVMFREGPWPGKRYTDAAGTYQPLTPLGDKSGAKIQGPSAEELARAEQMEARRRRGVSPMPAL